MKDVPELKAALSGTPGAEAALENLLIRAFVDGAKWWEYKTAYSTMWAEDRDAAQAEAHRRWQRNTLPSRRQG